MDAITAVITQGLILGIMVLGVYISYKILDFPDMSADGSFTLGGAIIALSLKSGLSCITGSVLALMAGLLAGLLTGILHVKVKISNLLSGILVMGILYSINLRIMGRANIPLFNENHLFNTKFSPLIIALILLVVFKLSLDLFLKTGIGYTLKAVGDNPQMVKSLGIEIGKIKILGLMLSNGLVCFSGSIMAQYQGFSDISMGIGTLVLGIASIIIGRAFVNKIKGLKETSMIIVGTIIYQITIYIAINIGMAATDLKMITSFVIILFLGIGQLKGNCKTNWLRGYLNVKNSKPIKEFS
ncbi:MAG: ABC transporter permease [Marinisporobacter sp.]|jgi:putative ABC transport system permease protein|nr:ABC transporter permease [Marinisporobacter sp.]